MENLKTKIYYLNRKSEQLRQWKRVIDRIKKKAENANGVGKYLILQHIENIQRQKLRLENILDQIKKTENERWDISKTNLDNNWMTLRESILEASNTAKNIINE